MSSRNGTRGWPAEIITFEGVSFCEERKMKNPKALLSIVLVAIVVVVQIGTVLAAPAARQTISGTVAAVACESDTATGGKTFVVTLQAPNGTSQIVRLDPASAESLGLVELGADGSPDCSPDTLANVVGVQVTLDSKDILPTKELTQHPVGAALATFFSEITDYATIMDAHETGAGFGLIAQALWLTRKSGGDTDIFLAILRARKTGDYSAFALDDGTPVPQSWGQFRKLILDGDTHDGLGLVISNKEKEHGNNAGGNGNGQENGNANGQGDGNGNPDHGKNDDKGNHGHTDDRGNKRNP
jgi:hypothetical protein